MQNTQELTADRPTDTKPIVDGLRRVEGHVGAVRRMVEEGRTCDEILTQVAAVKAALNRVTVRLVHDELAGSLDGNGTEDRKARFDSAMRAMASMLKHS